MQPPTVRTAIIKKVHDDIRRFRRSNQGNFVEVQGKNVAIELKETMNFMRGDAGRRLHDKSPRLVKPLADAQRHYRCQSAQAPPRGMRARTIEARSRFGRDTQKLHHQKCPDNESAGVSRQAKGADGTDDEYLEPNEPDRRANESHCGEDQETLNALLSQSGGNPWVDHGGPQYGQIEHERRQTDRHAKEGCPTTMQHSVTAGFKAATGQPLSAQ
jgi:hypothetical protein